MCVASITGAQTVPRAEREPTMMQACSATVELVLVLLATTVTRVVVRRGSVDSEIRSPSWWRRCSAAAAVVVLRLLLAACGVGGDMPQPEQPDAEHPLAESSQAVAISQQVVVASAAVVMAVSSAVIAVALTDTLRLGSEQTGWEQVGSDVVVQAAGVEDDTAEDLAASARGSRRRRRTLPRACRHTERGVEGVAVAFDSAAMRETTGES